MKPKTDEGQAKGGKWNTAHVVAKFSFALTQLSQTSSLRSYSISSSRSSRTFFRFSLSFHRCTLLSHAQTLTSFHPNKVCFFCFPPNSFICTFFFAQFVSILRTMWIFESFIPPRCFFFWIILVCYDLKLLLFFFLCLELFFRWRCSGELRVDLLPFL